LLSAAVTASGSAFEPESPKEIVRIIALNIPHSGGDYQTYAVSADGQRILMVQYAGTAGAPAAAASTSPDPPLSITVARNWSSSLKK
jgi:hypothetical protein